jgi:hypothetical protein
MPLLARHLGGPGVQAVGTIERDGGDGPVRLVLDLRVVHCPSDAAVPPGSVVRPDRVLAGSCIVPLCESSRPGLFSKISEYHSDTETGEIEGEGLKSIEEEGVAEVATGPGLDTFRGPSRVERAVLPFLREPTLWPVLLAVLAHAIALVAPLMVLAWRDDSGWSIVGLLVLGAMTAAACRAEIRGRGRPGGVAGLLAVTWMLCGAGAYAAVLLGIL